MRIQKRYNTPYKKKVDIESDVYLARRAPKGPMRCYGCGAVYFRRRWMLHAGGRAATSNLPNLDLSLCPACKKIRDRYPGGELRLSGLPAAEEAETLRILRNEEARARVKNPLERIMSIDFDRAGNWIVATTTEKLAQRLGRALRKARGGRVEYRWSHCNKYARVIWESKKRPEGGEA